MAVGILVVDVGEGPDLGPSAVGLEQQRAEGDAGEAHLAPVRAPGVPDPPVVEPALLVRAPAGDGDNVVDGFAGRVGDDAARVVQDVVRVDPARDGPAAVDLVDHGPASAYPAPVGDRGVRVAAQADALAAPGRERAAGPRHVQRRARPLPGCAESDLRVGGASHVGVLRLVGDSGAGRPRPVVQPAVHAGGVAPVAGAREGRAAGVDAVEHVLHREVDLDPAAAALDLDAVRER
mmetsp:Transcript_25167/g.74838  ORF Transcript_25167/g.74838 Transcript_25167/m.74838 type:complete len:235 (+) Transcript_25167:218-922(+)